VQNVSYHVEKMETAGLITSVDTWYSSRGREMDVFAATSQPLVLVSEDPARVDVEGVSSD
jgi:predicted transcriptional regulator